MKKEDAARINGAINEAYKQNRELKAEIAKLRAMVTAEQSARIALEARLNQLAAKVFSGGPTVVEPQ